MRVVDGRAAALQGYLQSLLSIGVVSVRYVSLPRPRTKTKTDLSPSAVTCPTSRRRVRFLPCLDSPPLP